MTPTSFDPWITGQGHLARAAQEAKTPKDAAQAFEALLLRQLLAAARSSHWLSGESETESGWREMADDAMAGHLAKVGGLGLAKQIASLLGQVQAERALPTEAASAESLPSGFAAPRLRPLDLSSLNRVRDLAVNSQTREAAPVTEPHGIEGR